MQQEWNLDTVVNTLKWQEEGPAVVVNICGLLGTRGASCKSLYKVNIRAWTASLELRNVFAVPGKVCCVNLSVTHGVLQLPQVFQQTTLRLMLPTCRHSFQTGYNIAWHVKYMNIPGACQRTEYSERSRKPIFVCKVG